ncbi:hypothetical protein [Streptomyces sp. 5-10]|uniref:hypothetical protein n=1 Tax=Streptomyces sp. 5-10 TaxID=878925 RepID=UPI00168ABB15|nr:hypothetical protein [Streptomyces sp. 5-10]MBD3004670.1 hypothetical protein [Streptomyces sp. 5-10]
MSEGKPRTTQAATEARKAVLDALQSGRALTEQEARSLADRLMYETRRAGWSAGYDAGFADGQYQDCR